LRAKVADFGLVRPAPENEQRLIETRVAGTFGYLDPDYAGTEILILLQIELKMPTLHLHAFLFCFVFIVISTVCSI